MKHYVIGDVHGHYDTLLALVDKLPKDVRLIFVGDLIDRGPKSMEVVKFVREGGHMCVMGNHEELMTAHGAMVLEAYQKNEDIYIYNNWFRNGGVATTRSYGVAKLSDGRPVKVEESEDALHRFKEDIKWMEQLPLFIELDVEHTSGLPVVISHAPVATVWGLRNADSMYKTFRDMALWNRRDPTKGAKIFNIFGHTPVEFGVEIEDHYVNVDTGCYVNEHGYGELSAYCVESGEVVKVNRRLEELNRK